MIDYEGRLVGMVSTHFRRPHCAAAPDLRIMELYADWAGQAAFASQAGQMADRWEQPPSPEAPPDTRQDRA
jgi:hypothetical protein